MQGITDTIKDLSSTAADKLGQAGDYLKANPAIAAMLAAGSGAGLLGGYLTAQEPEDENESKTSRRLRILRNALLSAGAGAGVVGLGNYGLNRLSNAIPEGMPHPIQERFESPPYRISGGIAGGLLGLRAGKQMDLKDEALQAISKFDEKNLPENALGLDSDPEKIIARAKRLVNFKGKPTGFINIPEVDKATLKYDLDQLFKNKLNTNLGNKLNNLVGADKINRVSDVASRGIASSSEALSKALRLIIGRTRAGQLARLGAAGGLAIPEIAGEVKDLVVGDY